MSAHAPGLDGLCLMSDLPPGQCSGCRGDELGDEPRGGLLRHWDEVAYSQTPTAIGLRAVNARTAATAHRAGRPWERWEDEAVRGWEGPLEELAVELGRTYEAVHMRRFRQQHGEGYR